MAWIYLIFAGIFEIGWPIGIKLAQQGEYKIKGLVLAVVAMGISGWLLYLAQRDISIGTAYAIWTGIGAAGTFLVGILFFGDATSLGRYFGVILIITGVVTLKLTN